MSEYVLEMKGIGKDFPGVRALDDVSFNLKAGEIHCLIGENGAGKSTLIKCLGGIHQPDQGQILIDGEPVVIDTAKVSKDHGIGIIYQELTWSPDLPLLRISTSDVNTPKVKGSRGSTALPCSGMRTRS